MHNSIVTNQSTQSDQSPFDSIRRFDEHGNEYWLARELQRVLGYVKWERFNGVIQVAIENVETVTDNASGHASPYWEAFGKTNQQRLNYKLSRLACYHVALCCDSRGNDAVKLAKHYFAIKTRQAETVIPAQSEKLRELELVNQNLKLQSEILKMAGHICDFHSPAIALALMGRGDCIVKQETIVTEIVEPDTGNTTKILTADQLKKAVKDRTGQKLKSLKTFVDSLREAGRDDLLIPVKRSHVAEYPIPEKLDEAIAVVYGKCRQKLIGEN